MGRPHSSAKTQAAATTYTYRTGTSIAPSIAGGTIARTAGRRARRAPRAERLYHLAMSTLETRREQMFPKLSPEEIERLRRFGTVRRYRAGEALYRTGEISPGMFVIISGSVSVTRREGLGRVLPILEEGPGDFLAEVGQLSGRPSFVDAHAITDVETLLVPTDRLRALLIAEAELGERIIRALILRRVALVEAGAGGPILIGPPGSLDVVRLQGFLARNAWPHQVLDPTEDRDAAALLERYAPRPSDLPLVVCTDGSVLKNPREGELADCLGMVRIDHPDRTYDVAVVGAGPAGLARAVYAAAEGRGVWYWVSPIEARLCRQQHVALVGGGNSAGQAAVFLSRHAAKVSMLVRGDGLAATMSRYLIDRIEATPNIEVLTRTEVVALIGAPGSHLERVRWRRTTTGEETELPIRNLFLFVGADPATQWLQGCGVALDAKGFVRTGSGDGQSRPLPLESNVRGVFAVGDVRSESVKRVGAAIGEGAAVVAQLHTVLAETATAAR